MTDTGQRRERIKRCGKYNVRLTHTDKTLYGDPPLTKDDLFRYHEKIADVMLPYLRDRMLTMERYPDGIDREGFFHKQLPDYFPRWFARATVDTEDGKQRVPICNNLASLLYLVNQGSLTQHIWLSRRDRPQTPDRMIFDLDPPQDDFEPVRRAAIDCIHLLDQLGLPSYVKTTGSRGLHVTVPLRREHGFDDVREFARNCAHLLIMRKPDSYTLEQRIAARGGRLYLDIQRNAYGQTVVAPFSLRAKPGAPVATPIAKSRLQDADLHASYYTIANIFRYLAQAGDPWHGMNRKAKSLHKADERLTELLAESQQ